MTHRFFEHAAAEEFDEESAPDWLTSKNSVPGSTMDGRWFWNDHVLTLGVGEKVDTDFRTIMCIAKGRSSDKAPSNNMKLTTDQQKELISDDAEMPNA